MRTPMLDDSVTRVFDRASKRKRRVTYNGVARYTLEDCDFVSVPKVSFAAFMIEYDDVVGELLLVVHNNFRAALAKGLDNLSRLGTGPPCDWAAKEPWLPPAEPLISQDSLSVMKTRGFSPTGG